jgi:serine/threonine-protein kinase
MIIHRDIKPQNVLIMEDGRVKITDFGIAMALNSNELTQTNSVMGSVHYLPPEQANGSGATLKSDIYSLGILMFELLTGKLPFKGDSAVEIAIKQMKEERPSVREDRPDIPQSVENVIIKACAKNPKNRYDSVNDMYDDLKTVLDPSRAHEEKYTYLYPEHDLEDTKIVPTVQDMKETRTSRNEELKEIDKIEKNEKKLNRNLIIVGSIVGFLIVAIIIIFIFFNSRKTTVIAIPEDLEGMDQAEVVEKLEKLGFETSVEVVANDEIEEGKVVKTDPNGKEKIKKGSTVTVYVSSGFDGITVEDYTGKNVEVIKKQLEAQNIQVISTPRKISSTNEDDIGENEIIEQDIAEGEKLKTGGVIELTYATLIVTYPDFTEEKYDEVRFQQFCDDNNLTCNIIEKETSEYAAGTIYGQSRQVGDEVKEGNTLTVYIAKEVTPTYTVTFESNGGSSVSAQEVLEGEKAKQPSNPTKAATEKETYKFVGWTLKNSACNSETGLAASDKYSFDTTVTESIKLYACYTVEKNDTNENN